MDAHDKTGYFGEEPLLSCNSCISMFKSLFQSAKVIFLHCPTAEVSLKPRSSQMGEMVCAFQSCRILAAVVK